MVDALWHLLDQVGDARVSLWPRLVAVSKGDILALLLRDPRITFCRLVLHTGDERVNSALVAAWQARFGVDSLVHTRTHAKLATLEGAGMRFLLRGSLNLGVGQRYEQCDLTEGGADFALVRATEEALSVVGQAGPARRPPRVPSREAAAQALGPLAPGVHVFGLTHGAFGLCEMLLHVLDATGPAHVTLWTWAAAAKEIAALQAHPHAVGGTLVVDKDVRTRPRNNPACVVQWRARYGPDSVRYVVSHAKMALVTSATHQVLVRGSFNFNQNPRLEQFDVTEGGEDAALVARVTAALPCLPDDVSSQEVAAACQVGSAVQAQQALAFRGLKAWAR